ncbi:hypothetical protein FA95DRAFT_1612203 [Auriscalpium vulgare]|uniref:Uncharacterized protein n=1 Tax=Auriscalpium vulgare TaxID=40419 RepID=A0ACB8R8E5_9AGAM|nr:hypothetical protein FA95DRAFT_1612203 [Auriscalpium vulgare]
MDGRQSSQRADKAATLQWLYDHMTKQVIHKTGCPICRAYFLHVSEAILVEDASYIAASKKREGANQDHEKEIQRLKDRLRRREDEIERLRAQLAARHDQHGDDAMSLGEDQPAPGDGRSSRKRRAGEHAEALAPRTETPRVAASEAPRPATGTTSAVVHDPGPAGIPAGTSQEHAMGFPAQFTGTYPAQGMYAPVGMYAHGSQPVVWPDGTTWMPNDGAQPAMSGWGGAANWAADWRPNTYTSGARTMENNWASSSRAPDWANRPWDPPYDGPGLVPWPEPPNDQRAFQYQGNSGTAPATPNRGRTMHRGIPTGPARGGFSRGRPAARGVPRAPTQPVASSSRAVLNTSADAEIDAFLTDEDDDADAPSSSSGGGTSSQQVIPLQDVEEIRRLFEEVKTPGNRNALQTLGRWYKEACETPQSERDARHKLLVRHYRRPQWAASDELTKKLPQPFLADSAKRWHAYFKRYPGFKRRGLLAGATLADVLSYLRIARLVHDGVKDEWTERKRVRDEFVLTAAAIVQTVEGYQRLREKYGVTINPIGATPDFGITTLVTEQSVVEHLARAGFADYEAETSGHFAHAVLTDPRYENGSQGSTGTGSDGDPSNTGTPIVVDEPVIADGSPAAGNSQTAPLDVAMNEEDDELPSPAPSA